MLEAVMALWAGDNVTYEGTYYRFKNITVELAMQRPIPAGQGVAPSQTVYDGPRGRVYPIDIPPAAPAGQPTPARMGGRHGAAVSACEQHGQAIGHHDRACQAGVGRDASVGFGAVRCVRSQSHRA